jgi:hypothetical protein
LADAKTQSGVIQHPQLVPPLKSADAGFSNMGVDEQNEEREVLNSIFPDEITGQIRPAPHSYKVAH